MAKVKLNQRLDEEIVERLMHLQSELKITLSDLIWNALDAFEREQNVVETVMERMEFLQENVAALVNDMKGYDAKMAQFFAQASAEEKERLGCLYQLLEEILSEHDRTEKERFERMKRQAW